MANATSPIKTRKPPAHIEVYFDVRDRSYWHKLGGRYISLGPSDMREHMRHAGLFDNDYHDGVKETDWPMFNARINKQVDYAGGLAGHRVGAWTDPSGRRHLITESANVWDEIPKRLPPPKFFLDFIQELLPDDQWAHYCHWLTIAFRSLRGGDFKPGQIACFAGPALCGKSLAQYFITQVLGGRSANPWPYIRDGKFNYDLAKAEHWQIEDPKSSTDLRTRRGVGDMLKECANNEEFNVHPKGKDAIKLPVFRRISISINDEPENLAVIPPLDDSLKDKVTLYKCNHVSESLKQFIVQTPALNGFGDIVVPVGQQDRAAIKAKIREELPAIRSYLLRTFVTVPECWRGNDRCGIRSIHHPELEAELVALAPETRLLQLIDEVCFDKSDSPWTGKSIDLEKQLLASSVNFEVQKVLRFSGSCGSYLSRLAKSTHRVVKRVKDGYTHWTIKAPSTTTTSETEQAA